MQFSSENFFSQMWLKLLALNVIVFIAEVAGGDKVVNLLAFVPANALAMPWTIVTSIFVHADVLHIFFNMFALFMFGPLLERIIGGKRFLALFLITGILGNVAFSLFYPSNVAGIGASGAIYGILGALAVLTPNMLVFVLFIPMPMWMAAIGWAIFEYLSSLTPSPIANMVHLAGLAVGVLAGLYLKEKLKGESTYFT